MMNIREKLNGIHTDVIVVTYNNEPLLRRCLYSLAAFTGSPFSLHIVNNGDRKLAETTMGKVSHLCHVYDTGKNLGWIGGINYVKDKVKGPFVLMLNDDTQVIDHDFGWLRKLQLPFFLYTNVGATGPISNAAMGLQFINCAEFLPRRHTANVLSGFCMLTKKEHLDKLGWLDESLPGGDDVDYSIRLQDAGLATIVCRDTTVLHTYGATGKRLFGEYWNSTDYTDKINIALIRKHGLKRILENMHGMYQMPMDEAFAQQKSEVEEIVKWVGGKKGLNLGCGDKKYPGDTGVDLTPCGEIGMAGSQVNAKSAADVVCDVEKRLPFEDQSQDYVLAEDLLEHVINPIRALREWNRVLKPGGILLIFVPDEDRTDGILLDPTHTHAFDLEFLEDLVISVGGYSIRECKRIFPGNGLLCVAEKIGSVEAKDTGVFHELCTY